ncbi:MAG: hypothetical protein Hyperionvirus20_41 [Hyperionvirus sp.]|uniref:Uncharacterized protein n=1 Tax=Hyperionvirus sp. TaxID=2487770 RepID=A0A3G5AEG2_9VIRU|nr:MAG: hypothetical protein Hyperionvirus20_41 [Hyperionvirus sp.]
MIYMFCSCRELLGDKAKHYERSLEEICQKNEMGMFETNEEFEKEKQDLVNSYGFRRYCCKQRLMTYIRTVKIVK